MLKKSLYILTFLFAILFFNCAKRGTITGGLKDTIAPELKSSFPKNYSTLFNAKVIKINFDEFVKLKDLNKQLVISPPMKSEPLILPTAPSKYLTIRITDTLQPNTTYNINFGQSITDNNEGNVLNQFKYVFSTGKYIDSLALRGRVKDAYAKEADSFVSILLYEMNEKYKDSAVYKQNPRYITNTLDSLKTFSLENLKAGKYMLVALKDVNKNNKFNPKDDKIGFIKYPINIPNDTIFELELFKENQAFKAIKPIQASGNRLYLGYTSKQDFEFSKPKIVLKNNKETLPIIVTQMPKKDSLQIWFKPIKADSLQIEINRDQYNQKYSFKIKNQKKDTLNIKAIQNGTINLLERFTLESNTPLVNFDKTRIKITNTAKEAVNFTTDYDVFNQKMFVDFDKKESEKYDVKILPGALTDFFDKKNDTLIYNLSTKEKADYGNLKVKLENIKRFPIVVELTNNKNETQYIAYTTKEKTVDFNLIEPMIYTLRIIYDDNKNKKHDPGNFLEKKYAEEVIYLSKEIDIRANWDVEQVFDLSIPYTPTPKKKKKKPAEQNN